MENPNENGNATENPQTILVTEAQWRGKRETVLFGLTKTPKKTPRKVPGYAPAILREDAIGILKEMASKSPSRRVGTKELLTAIVLLGAENDTLKAVLLAKAKAVAIEDLEKELSKAEAEDK